MRKTTSLFRLIALAACLSLALGASAYDFVANGLYYNITGSNTVEVTAKPGLYSGDITIPSTVTRSGKTYQVNAIGANAFKSCVDLTGVTIPNSVITIGNNAFRACNTLDGVHIPNSVTTIGDNAFYGCSELVDLLIGSGVTEIGDSAFMNCHYGVLACMATVPPAIQTNSFDYHSRPSGSSGGISVVIHCNVPAESLNAYKNADNWKKFDLYEMGFDFYMNGLYYTITGDRTVEVAPKPNRWYSGSISIPAMVSNGGTVYRVTGIGEGAFAYTGIVSVSIPNSVTTIALGAFVFCQGLTSITVASDNPVYDSRNNCNAIIETASNTLVAGCKNTVIPGTVTAIGQAAFLGVELTSMTISDRVTTIGEGAFFYCTSLTSVTIGSGVTSIGVGTFAGCEALTSLVCMAATPPAVGSDDGGSLADESTYSTCTLTVPKGCKAAYQAAVGWQNFTTIKEVSYDFAVNGICYDIKGTNTVEVTENPALYSGNVNIPSEVTYDGTTYQVIGIGPYAFEVCSNLTGVAIPNTVTYIGDAAFTSCINLTNLIIPNSVTTVGWYAFAYCERLENVNIGSGMTSIGDNAFAGCLALSSLTCLAATPPTIGENTFDSDTYANCVLKVLAASRNTYRVTTYWKNFAHIVAASQLGDVNSDGEIDIVDVTLLISYLLGEPVSGFNVDAANFNGDDSIDIVDVTDLITMILN